MMSNKNIFYATLTGDIQCIIECLNSGVDINAKNNKGYFPLYLACSYGLYNIAKMLVENGADVTIKIDEEETSLLHYVLFHADFEIGELLLNNGAVDDLGFTPYDWLESDDRSKRKWEEILENFHNSNSIKPAKRD